MRKLAMKRYFKEHPEEACDEICAFHLIQGTCAFGDLEYAQNLALGDKDVYETYENAMEQSRNVPINSLRDFVVFHNEPQIIRDMYVARYQRQYAYLGYVPKELRPELSYEIEKQAEFHAYTEMVDNFDYEIGEDGEYHYFSKNGITVSDSLIWEGSAHSFEDYRIWWEWREEHNQSWVMMKLTGTSEALSEFLGYNIMHR